MYGTTISNPSPTPPLSRRPETASSILAKFLPNSPTEHKMVAAHVLRTKAAVSYAEPDSSPGSPSAARANDISPGYGYRQEEEDEEENEEEAIQYLDPKATRRGSRTRVKVVTHGYRTPRAGRYTSQKTRTPASGREKGISLYDISLTPVTSDRRQIRDEIANVTRIKREAFFLEKKDYFLPLLPKNNFIEKQLARVSDDEKQPVVPFEELSEQPRGITATMKPYQISGLSFMVYLHRNGLSGILGDEMGLGKTLQTLSLFQYLKENEVKSTQQTQPFLVLCPLSVLSSWMAESKKWAPGLKVMRFHGPKKERDRLKRIAAGLEDAFGNMTLKQKAKLSQRGKSSRKGLDEAMLYPTAEPAVDANVDVVVTTYEAFAAEALWFKRAFVWRYVVLDEGHKIKNDSSNISRSLQSLQAEYRLILTGTPLQNDLKELWALLHWLYPEVFTEQTNSLFHNSFNLSKGLCAGNVLDDSRKLLELIMLRRLKSSAGVDLNLPPKIEMLLYVPLSPMQRFWYTRLITQADQGLLNDLFSNAKDKEELTLKKEEAEVKRAEDDSLALEKLSHEAGGSNQVWMETENIIRQTLEREKDDVYDEGAHHSAWRKLMNLLMQLRKVCNHPYTITNAEPDPYEIGDHVIHASGKLIVLEKLVGELVVKQRKKILIFSTSTRMLDLVEDFLMIRGGDGSNYKYARLDGSTGRARRNLGIRMFNDLQSEYRVMLISTRAGGLGINLASASDVVLLDQDWNPQITLQAEARAHRIGQVNPVTIYKFISQGTVEEQMMGRIQKKLYLSAKVTEAMQDNYTAVKGRKGPGASMKEAKDEMPQLSTSQLMTLVRRGTTALSRPEIDVNEMLEWDWATTVSKCKDQPIDLNIRKDGSTEDAVDVKAEAKWLSEMEKVESYVFEGKKLSRTTNKNASREAEEDSKERHRADRRLGKNTTIMVDGFAISKESMNCGAWEAVPTMAGKDPRLAEPKRAKKEAITNQSHCQVCMDGGHLHLCLLCPRAYHYKCLDDDFKTKATSSRFHCPQHQCHDCEQKTTDAGGMLYRCRWCERAYCEDCLDFSKTKLIDDDIVEYKVLDYPAVTQAFYVQCPSCTDHFEAHPQDRAVCELMVSEARKEYENGQSGGIKAHSPAASLTDAPTAATSPGIDTPIVIEDEYEPKVDSGKKRGARTAVHSAKKKKMTT